MLKILSTLIQIFIVIVFIEEICEGVYKRTSTYKKSWEQTRKLKSVPDKLEIVNIGSGPAYYGIDYSFCKKKGYNLATAPQNFNYGFKLLRHFSKNISKSATVIITIMAPMSFGYNKDIFRSDYSDKYYGILPACDIDGYSIRRLFITKHPLLIRFILKLKRNLKHNHTTSQTNKRSVVQIWMDEFELQNLKDANQSKSHKKTFEEKIDLLTEMIDYTRNNEWNVVLLIPPIPPKTREQISSDFLNEFVYENLNILQNKVGKLQILDYYDDQRFDESMFKNDIFLNDSGSQMFSTILFDDIEKEENYNDGDN